MFGEKYWGRLKKNALRIAPGKSIYPKKNTIFALFEGIFTKNLLFGYKTNQNKQSAVCLQNNTYLHDDDLFLDPLME